VIYSSWPLLYGTSAQLTLDMNGTRIPPGRHPDGGNAYQDGILAAAAWHA
jgi:hypothetical protein